MKSSLLPRTFLSLSLGALLMLISGCASTPYQPLDEKGAGGYASTMLTNRTYRVSFYGNGNSDGTQVRDFALIRAAEITLESGHTHFRVTHESNKVAASNHGARAAVPAAGAAPSPTSTSSTLIDTTVPGMPTGSTRTTVFQSRSPDGQTTAVASVRTSTPAWGGSPAETYVTCVLHVEVLEPSQVRQLPEGDATDAAQLLATLKAKHGVK